MRFTAFTFIQVFYLLGFHLYKFATFSFLSPWNLAKVSDNRFTVSTSAETEGNRWRGGGVMLLPEWRQRRSSGKSEESTLAVVGFSEGPPPLEDSPTAPLCCLLQSHWRGQRLLKVTFTDHR